MADRKTGTLDSILDIKTLFQTFNNGINGQGYEQFNVQIGIKTTFCVKEEDERLHTYEFLGIILNDSLGHRIVF